MLVYTPVCKNTIFLTLNKYKNNLGILMKQIKIKIRGIWKCIDNNNNTNTTTTTTTNNNNNNEKPLNLFATNKYFQRRVCSVWFV